MRCSTCDGAGCQNCNLACDEGPFPADHEINPPRGYACTCARCVYPDVWGPAFAMGVATLTAERDMARAKYWGIVSLLSEQRDAHYAARCAAEAERDALWDAYLLHHRHHGCFHPTPGCETCALLGRLKDDGAKGERR